MVVVAATIVVEDNAALITWAVAADGDTGRPVDVSRFPTMSVQCTAGTIGTSSLQGSQDGATWGALGAGLAIAASNRVDAVTMNPKFIRPTFGAAASGAVVQVNAARDG